MTIGRAVALCLRNIGGQRAGETTKSVFGQPARFGFCIGEWEERSPWPSLAERRGFTADQDVVTVHGGKGTFPMADIHNDDARDLLYLIAKSIAYPLANMFLGNVGNGEVVVAINPMWAERFGAAFPDVEDLQAYLHEHAWQPIELWPDANAELLRERTASTGAAACTSSSGPTRSCRSCAAASAACTRSRCRASARARCRASPSMRGALTMDQRRGRRRGRRARPDPARRRRRPPAARREPEDRARAPHARARRRLVRGVHAAARRSAGDDQRRRWSDASPASSSSCSTTPVARREHEPLPSWSALVAVYQSVLHDVVAALDEEAGIDSGVFSALAYLERAEPPHRLPMARAAGRCTRATASPGSAGSCSAWKPTDSSSVDRDPDDRRATIVVTTRGRSQAVHRREQGLRRDAPHVVRPPSARERTRRPAAHPRTCGRVSQPVNYDGRRAVLPRTVSSVGSTWWRTRGARAGSGVVDGRGERLRGKAALAATSWRTVVSIGSCTGGDGLSSKPTTDRSSGTASPRCRRHERRRTPARPRSTAPPSVVARRRGGAARLVAASSSSLLRRLDHGRVHAGVVRARRASRAGAASADGLARPRVGSETIAAGPSTVTVTMPTRRWPRSTRCCGGGRVRRLGRRR